MVLLHVKRGDESQFLYDTVLSKDVHSLVEDLVAIYNGRLKIHRICYEIEDLAKHGTALAPNMQGLTDEQIEELKLVDEWGEKCEPSGGWTFNKDPMGRRNGKQPSEHIQNVLTKTTNEVKALVSKKLIDSGSCLKTKDVMAALDMLKGAVMIAYPMGLPPHDPIQLEIENNEDLSGTQASLEVLESSRTSVWFCNKEMRKEKKLVDYLGKNEKTKVIVKLQKIGQGAPAREPMMSEEEHKAMLAHLYRKQEDFKKLEEDTDNDYLNSSWADNSGLKKSLHGISSVVWRPK